MKKVILDTNFILTCVKQKIDFFNEMYLEGFGILIPREAVRELNSIAKSGKKLKFRESARIALKLIEKNRHEEIELKTGNVDNGIVRFAKENPEIAVATLDREVKRKTKNPKLVIKGKKMLEII